MKPHRLPLRDGHRTSEMVRAWSESVARGGRTGLRDVRAGLESRRKAMPARVDGY